MSKVIDIPDDYVTCPQCGAFYPLDMAARQQVLNGHTVVVQQTVCSPCGWEAAEEWNRMMQEARCLDG